MPTEPDPSAAASDPLTIDVEAKPVPPAPRAVRTGRFSADDLAPPAPAPRMSGKLRPEDFAAIADPAPTRPADFEAVDIASMKAQLNTQRRAKLRPDSVFAGAAKAAPPAASPAPSAPSSSTRQGAHASGRAGKTGWPPLRRPPGDGPSDADTIIDVTARVIDTGDGGNSARRATSSARTASTAPAPAPAPAPAASASPATASARHAAAASPPARAGQVGASAHPRATAEMHPHRHRDRVDRSAPDSEPWPISEDSSTVPPPRRSAPAAAGAHSPHPPTGRGAGGAGVPPPPPPSSTTGAAAFEPEAERTRQAGSATDPVHDTASAATGAAAPPHPASGAASPRRRAPSAAPATAATRTARPSGAPGFPPGLLKQCALALLSAGGGTFLLTMGWSFFGAWGVLPLVWGLQALVAGLADRFERRDKFMTANWLATLAIICTPLSVFYAQHALGWWPPLQGLPPNTYGSGIIEIDWRRVSMDGLTTLFAWGMFMRHRHPVMLLPVTMALWYTLVEVGSYVLTARGLDLRFLAQVTAVYGLGAVLTSARIRALGRAMPADTERRAGERPEHYAFWLEALGALMLWAALWSYGPTTQAGRAAHLAAQLGLIALGWRLRRHLLSALGMLGLALHAAALATGELSPLVLLEPVLAPVAGWMAAWRH